MKNVAFSTAATVHLRRGEGEVEESEFEAAAMSATEQYPANCCLIFGTNQPPTNCVIILLFQFIRYIKAHMLLLSPRKAFPVSPPLLKM